MEKALTWIRTFIIIIGISALIISASDNKVPLSRNTSACKNIPLNKNTSPLNHSSKTATICGEVVSVYDMYEYCLRIKSDKDSTLYDVVVPESEKTKKFETGDFVIISYSGSQLDSNPGVLLEVISIEIE